MPADHPTHEARTPPRSPLQRLARNVAIVVFGALALVALSALAYVRYWSLQRDRALERIREAGDPVLADDVAQSLTPNEATLGWMRAVAALRETVADWNSVAGAEPAEYRAYLAEVAASDAPLAAREAALAFDRVVLGEAERAGGGDEGLRTTLAAFKNAWESQAKAGFAAVRLAWLEFVAADSAAHCELAHAARGLAPITLRESRALTPDEPAWIAGLETWHTHELVVALSSRAQLRALRGDAAGAVSDARAILDVAALESQPSDIGGLMRLVSDQRSYLLTVGQLLERAPPGLDSTTLATELPAEPLLAALRSAARAERALWNEHCAEQAAQGLFLPDDELFATPRQRWLGWLFRARNQCWVLDEYERTIPAIDFPSSTRTSWRRNTSRPGGTQLGDLRPVEIFGARDAIDAFSLDAVFLRIRAAWHANGVTGAETRARASLDPFDGGPLRSSRSGGRLRAWSVGPNGLDQGGRSESTFGGADDLLLELGDE